MKINDLINEMNEKKIVNTQIKPDAVESYLKKKLEIKTYVPFAEKRKICEMVVGKNSTYEDGILKIDSVGQYISFVVAMLCAHTNLEFSSNPTDDYDFLCEVELLETIVSLFKKSYSECEVILKLIVADKCAYNNTGAVFNRFLNGVSTALDGIVDGFKNKFENFNINDIFGEQINEDDLVALKQFLDKNNK